MEGEEKIETKARMGPAKFKPGDERRMFLGKVSFHLRISHSGRP
jgi:hypothetical protein